MSEDKIGFAKVRIDTTPDKDGWCFCTPANHPDDVQRGLVQGGEWNEAAQMYAQVSSSQSRLSEAVKVLQPFAQIGDVILSEAPPNAFHAQLFTDSEGDVHTVSLEQFRAARQFLATIGEEND